MMRRKSVRVKISRTASAPLTNRCRNFLLIHVQRFIFVTMQTKKTCNEDVIQTDNEATNEQIN